MANPIDHYLIGRVAADVSALTADRTITLPDSDVDLTGYGKPSAWIAMSPLSGAWANFGAPFRSPAYRKTADGWVQLRGTIKGGSGLIFNLPPGFRPSVTVNAVVNGNGGFASLNIESDGDVILQHGAGNTFLHLDSVRFFPD